jgi:ubiquinone/menaquinone biosynthesis C-methylase UbiE
MFRLKEKIVHAFDQLAVDYEHTVDVESVYNTHYERPAMMQLISKDLNGLSILDAGCAAGWYSEQFIKRGANVTSIDASSKMIEATKRRVGEHANAHCVDLNNELPFRDDSFDQIVSSLTIHYIEDWSALFKEFHRILKPGGTFLFSTHHPLMDYNFSYHKNYFKKELLVYPWEKPKAGIVDVPFYRRSLQEIFVETKKFFSIESFIEPQPIEQLKAKDEKAYEKLTHRPNFLIIKAKKRT